MKLEKNKYTALIDADTIIYSSAAYIQKNPVFAKNKKTEVEIEYENITAFREWLKESEEGILYKEKDFTFETRPYLADELSHALHTIKLKIERIENESWCKDIKIFVGGEGNYRKDAYAEYKAKRPDKPLAFQDCYNYVVKKWGKKVTICDFREAEDDCGCEAWKVYDKAFKEKDVSLIDVIICHVDKDVNMIPGYHYNYDKPEEGVKWISSVEAWENFCSQCLKGDRSTDNIPGVNSCNEELINKYGLRRGSKSVGDKGAEVILKEAKGHKELFERVVDTYKIVFGDEWKEKLNLNILLLWIRREYGQVMTLEEICDKLGIDYD